MSKENYMIWDNSDNGKGDFYLYKNAIDEFNKKLTALNIKITKEGSEYYRDEFETVDDFIERKNTQINLIKSEMKSKEEKFKKTAFNKTFGKQEIELEQYQINTETFKVKISQKLLKLELTFDVVIDKAQAKLFKEKIFDKGFSISFNKELKILDIKANLNYLLTIKNIQFKKEEFEANKNWQKLLEEFSLIEEKKELKLKLEKKREVENEVSDLEEKIKFYKISYSKLQELKSNKIELEKQQRNLESKQIKLRNKRTNFTYQQRNYSELMSLENNNISYKKQLEKVESEKKNIKANIEISIKKLINLRKWQEVIKYFFSTQNRTMLYKEVEKEVDKEKSELVKITGKQDEIKNKIFKLKEPINSLINNLKIQKENTDSLMVTCKNEMKIINTKLKELESEILKHNDKIKDIKKRIIFKNQEINTESRSCSTYSRSYRDDCSSFQDFSKGQENIREELDNINLRISTLENILDNINYKSIDKGQILRDGLKDKDIGTIFDFPRNLTYDNQIEYTQIITHQNVGSHERGYVRITNIYLIGNFIDELKKYLPICIKNKRDGVGFKERYWKENNRRRDEYKSKDHYNYTYTYLQSKDDNKFDEFEYFQKNILESK